MSEVASIASSSTAPISKTEIVLSNRTGDVRESKIQVSIEENEILARIQELQMQLVKLKQQDAAADSLVENSNDSSFSKRKGIAGRLIVVSNTLPIELEKSVRTRRWRLQKTTSGLDKLMCLDGLRTNMPFLWLGSIHNQEIHQKDHETINVLLQKVHCVPVFLNPKTSTLANAFSSNVLWSLFHYNVPEQSEQRFAKEQWQAYQSVNESFAQVIAGIYQPGDQIWIHDHNLILLPSYLRKLVQNCTIGWFLHTPFPSSDVYRRLSVRKELLNGLLCSDLLGFQTYDYARHFLSSCQLVLGIECTPKGIRVDPQHFMSLGVYPIGIDVAHFSTNSDSITSRLRLQELQQTFKGTQILLGLDRLDYIKGIPHKLLAMEVLLTRYPEWRHKVVMIQIGIATKSQGGVLADQINQIVGRINGAFGTLDYHPIHFIEQNAIDTVELCALYKLADVCVVTSTRDGMNLVSHEFVVCQNTRAVKGSLVLSEFAGCAQSLSGAVLVNPWNTEDVAAALHQALTMSPIERELRQQKLYRYVSTNTVTQWAEEFIEELMEAKSRNLVVDQVALPRLLPRDALTAYRRAKNRVIMIDYDGTLTPTIPSTFFKSVLESLSQDPMNTVFIVSSRERRVLETWLDNIPVGMAAEDGLFYRMSSTEQWQTMSKYANSSTTWKELVIPIMQSFTERTPGSYIESKENSLTWHYRDSDLHFGSWQAKDLHTTLERQLCGTALEVVQSNRLVEVKHEGCTKSTILEAVLKYLSLPEQVNKRQSEVDFVFCVGDDASDDQMFQTLNRLHSAAKDETVTNEAPMEQEEGDPNNRKHEDDSGFRIHSLEYEAVRLKPDSSIFTVKVGSMNASSNALYCLHTLGHLRRILRGFAEISRSSSAK